MSVFVRKSTDSAADLFAAAGLDWAWDVVFDESDRGYLVDCWGGTFDETDGKLVITVLTKDKADELAMAYRTQRLIFDLQPKGD